MLEGKLLHFKHFTLIAQIPVNVLQVFADFHLKTHFRLFECYVQKFHALWWVGGLASGVVAVRVRVYEKSLYKNELHTLWEINSAENSEFLVRQKVNMMPSRSTRKERIKCVIKKQVNLN